MFKVTNNELMDLINIKYNNIEVTLSNLGASIIDIKYIDFSGNKESVVSHPININDFINNDAYYGKTCGRYSGRLDKAKLNIEDNIYELDKNWLNISNLHGGKNGVSDKLWNYEITEEKEKTNIIFKTLCLDNESGFPGNLEIEVTYTITFDSVEITYKGNTDKTTVCNLTNHTYFNLSGNCKNTILDHSLYINASKYTNLNNELICTSIDNVNKTFDFTNTKLIKEDIYDEELQKHISKGYDHCFLFNDISLNKCNITLYDNISKRNLEVYTTYPSVVVYTTNYPKDNIVSNNEAMKQFGGICLETQYIPNGINFGIKDKTLLKSNDLYEEKTIFKFSIKK